MAVRQYVGARYVPKFYQNSQNPLRSDWEGNKAYEALTIVQYNNSSYTSKIPVPAGIGNPADNPTYWVNTGDYNTQVEQYRQQTVQVGNQLDGVQNNLNAEITNREEADTALETAINDKNDWINPEQYGAVGDGKTDDATAIQNALNTGKNVLLNEKTYLVKTPLRVNVNKQWLRGYSGRSIIFNSCGEDVPAVIFYSDGTFTQRPDRVQMHGHFSVRGTGNSGNGIQIADIDGTTNGGVEAQLFECIGTWDLNKGLVLGPHVYQDVFLKCNFDACRWNIFSDDASDTGERISFYNCGLWDGRVYCNHTCEFYECTFHLFESNLNTAGPNQTVLAEHYFLRETTFIGCHFEHLDRKISTIHNGLYVTKCQMENCYGVTSGTFTALSFVYVPSGGEFLTPNYCKITNCDFNMLLSDHCTYKNAFCVGRCNITGLVTKYYRDVSNTSSAIYSDTPIFKKSSFTENGFDYVYIPSSSGFTVTSENTDNGLKVNVSTEGYHNNKFIWLMNYVPTNGHTAIRISGDIIEGNGPTLYANYSGGYDSSVIFLDSGHNIITYNQYDYGIISSHNKNTAGNITNPFICQIPDGCVVMLVGLCLWIKEGTSINQSITTALKFEML